MDKFFQNNTVIKGVAFLLAIMLWMIISLDEQQLSPAKKDELSIDNVKVEAIYDKEIYEIMDMDYESVRVVLTGRRALLNLTSLKSDPYRVYVDLTGLEEGKHRVPLSYEGFPSELEVKIKPHYIHVVLEKKIFKAFYVTLETTGKLQDGYTLGKEELSEEQVRVIAPSSVLSRVAKVKGFIDIDGEYKDVEQSTELKVYDSLGNELKAEVSPSTIEVKYPVIPPSVKVPLKIELSNKFPEGVSLIEISSDVEEVEVFGSPNVLEKVKEVQVILDSSIINSSKKVKEKLTKEIDWHSIKPTSVLLDVQVGPTEQRTFNNIPIKVAGLTKVKKVEFISPTDGRLSVQLKGSRELLNKVAANKIKPVIDISKLSVGQHTVEVHYSLPPYIATIRERQYITLRIHSAEDS